VYTGSETKLQVGLEAPKKKVSKIERMINWYIVSILALLFVGAFISTIFSVGAG
jgi:hypothetical protein